MADKRPPGSPGWRRITFAGLTALVVLGVVEEVGPHAGYVVISRQDMTGMRDGYDWVPIKARNSANLWQDWPAYFIHFPIPLRADAGYFNTRYDTVSLGYSQTRGPVNYSGRLPGPPGSNVRPLIGDWHGTGTGRDGIGYYNPATGVFALRRLLSAGAMETFRFGPPHMIPLAGNWTGGRRDEVGFYNPAKGTFTLEGIIGSARVYRSFRFGPARMIPVAGNWDIGANESVAYYDPRTGAFYLRVPLSQGLATEIIRFGQPHMIPLTGDWFGGHRRA